MIIFEIVTTPFLFDILKVTILIYGTYKNDHKCIHLDRIAPSFTQIEDLKKFEYSILKVTI